MATEGRWGARSGVVAQILKLSEISGKISRVGAEGVRHVHYPQRKPLCNTLGGLPHGDRRGRGAEKQTATANIGRDWGLHTV